MYGATHWLDLGLRHPLWDLHRFFLSLAKKGAAYRSQWLEELRDRRTIKLEDGAAFPIDTKTVSLFFQYMDEREHQFEEAESLLRTEDEALAYCTSNWIAVGTTATQSQDHHQSSKAMIAAVTSTARKVCEKYGMTLNPDPQARCVWCNDNELHVSARNLDGAIPSLANPYVIWEIKEYWGKTKGGSKMSDAVYECHLVGLEIRDFEARGGPSISHVVFVDGKEQWGARKSDLRRLIDLMNQGLVNHLIVGREVEDRWESTLDSLVQSSILQG